MSEPYSIISYHIIETDFIGKILRCDHCNKRRKITSEITFPILGETHQPVHYIHCKFCNECSKKLLTQNRQFLYLLET
jgi:hypothetical protein